MPSWEWSVESAGHTSRVLRHKPCKVLDPDSAPFRRKCRCNLGSNTLQSAGWFDRFSTSRLSGISGLGKKLLGELCRGTFS